MNDTVKYYVPASLLLVGLLSACAPAPIIFQDQGYGYGGRMYPPPVYVPPPVIYQSEPIAPPKVQAPVVRTVPLPVEQVPKVEAVKQRPRPIPGPTMSEVSSAIQAAAVQTPAAQQKPSSASLQPVPEAQKPAVPPIAAAAASTASHYHTSAAVKSLIKQADTEASQGKAASAVATVERALRIEADNPDLWMKLSDLYERQGNHQQAVSMSEKAAYYRDLNH